MIGLPEGLDPDQTLDHIHSYRVRIDVESSSTNIKDMMAIGYIPWSRTLPLAVILRGCASRQLFHVSGVCKASEGTAHDAVRSLTVRG